jgi:hypothetical protein
MTQSVHEIVSGDIFVFEGSVGAQSVTLEIVISEQDNCFGQKRYVSLTLRGLKYIMFVKAISSSRNALKGLELRLDTIVWSITDERLR